MEQSKFDIRSGALFPWYYQLVGVLFTLIGLIFILENLIIALILIPIGTLILTGRSGIEINTIAKTYRSYYSFFFIKSGKQFPFQAVEKLYVNANKVKQTMYTAHTMQSSTFENRQFDAYIKFDNGKKEHLSSDKKKDKLMNRLKPLSEAVALPIVDNSIN
ncbi:MAG: hypothetical protein AAF519_14525 [Bacteroidota bacterium]